jgi:hypothetical protein
MSPFRKYLAAGVAALALLAPAAARAVAFPERPLNPQEKALVGTWRSTNPGPGGLGATTVTLRLYDGGTFLRESREGAYVLKEMGIFAFDGTTLTTRAVGFSPPRARAERLGLLPPCTGKLAFVLGEGPNEARFVKVDCLDRRRPAAAQPAALTIEWAGGR